MTPVEPRPAASVVLVREAEPGAREPIDVYVIRRHARMRFLGGYYAFPGGKVDPEDCSPHSLTRCRGLTHGEAEAIMATSDGVPALAYWLAAARELLEETGLLLVCDDAGRPLDPRPSPSAPNGGDRAGPPSARVDRRPPIPPPSSGNDWPTDPMRQALLDGAASFAELLVGAGWYCHVKPLRYLSHFISPTPSPIRYSARFFLCPVPRGQSPRLFAEETSEGFWIGPAEACRRFTAGEMPMAEPAESAFGYLAQFDSIADVWAAHADSRHKFHGIIDRTDIFYGEGFDWTSLRR